MPALPASPELAAAFLAELAEQGRSVATLRLQKSALAKVHRSAGHPDPTDNEGVRQVLAGIARANGRPQRQAKPLTAEALAAVKAMARAPRQHQGRARRGESPGMPSAAVIGVSLWIGIGFQNQVILPDLLTGTLGTLLSNGVTTGSVCVILLTLLIEYTSRRRRRLNVAMHLSSLPRIDSFLQEFATSVGWNEASISRLRSAGEETLSSLLAQDEELEEDARKRLIVAARRADAAIEMEFVVTTEGGNLEDKLAYLNQQPELPDEHEISFRLLRHYASSVQHHKYHGIDIITVQVAPWS